jgi:hypothetical protein
MFPRREAAALYLFVLLIKPLYRTAKFPFKCALDSGKWLPIFFPGDKVMGCKYNIFSFSIWIANKPFENKTENGEKPCLN